MNFPASCPFCNCRPTFLPRPKVQRFDGDQLPFEMDAGLSDQLRQLADEQNATMYMVLFAAYHVLLSKYAGQEDVIAGPHRRKAACGPGDHGGHVCQHAGGPNPADTGCIVCPVSRAIERTNPGDGRASGLSL